MELVVEKDRHRPGEAKNSTSFANPTSVACIFGVGKVCYLLRMMVSRTVHQLDG